MRDELNLRPTFEETLKRERGMVITGDMSVATLNRLAHQENVLKALEKQIPKKPIIEADGYYAGELVYDTWYCPSCDTSYETDYERHDYCPNCGQRIDWEEE